MTRARVFAALRWLVTLGALALILRVLGTDVILAQLRQVSAFWLAVAVMLLSAQIITSAARWQITAQALGLTLGSRAALREYYLSVLGNTVLPGGVVGDVGRAVRLRHQAGIGRATQSVVIERLAGQIALFAIMALGAVVWFWPSPAAMTGAAVLCILGMGVVMLLRRNAPDAPAPAGRLMRGLRLLRTAWGGRGVWPRQLGLSVLILACNIGGFWAAAQAIGLPLSVGAAIFVIPLTLGAMLVPVSINGWGLREGAAAAIWPIAGPAATEAVAASIVFGVAVLLAALPGLYALRRPISAV